MSYGVGHRRGLDLAWLWNRPLATALIQPLAWEPSYAVGAALEKTKRQKKKKKKMKKKALLSNWRNLNKVCKLDNSIAFVLKVLAFLK